MPFFDDKTDKQCQVWATRLRAAVKTKRKLMAVVNLHYWIKEFVALRAQVSAARLEPVLTWYELHIDEGHVPQAYSARSFRFFFSKIEERMMQCSETMVEVVKEPARKLVLRLTNDHKYPPEIVVQLPVLVQHSTDRWQRFCMTILEAMNTKTLLIRELQFLERVLEEQETILVENWCIFLSQKYGWLEHYTGNVITLTFKPDHQLFRDSFWRHWAQLWSGDSCAFDSLLQELLKRKPSV